MADHPSSSASSRGCFVWYELLSTDPDGAERFYSDVIGWSASPMEGSKTPYTIWTKGEDRVGGLMRLPDEAAEAGAPSHWMAYVSTPDVDATTERTGELGGKVLYPPTDIPGMGRFSVLMDPQGAVFAVWTAADEPSAPDGEGPPEPGRFTWHELLTTDQEAAFAFYSDLFGWEKTDAMDMGDEGVYQMYGQDGRTYGGMYNKPADLPAPPHWLFYTRVADLDAALDRVKASGGAVLNGPMEVPGGDRIAQCRDPQGAAFALHEVRG